MPEIIPNVFDNDKEFQEELIDYHNIARFRKMYKEMFRQKQNNSLVSLILNLLLRVKTFFVVIFYFIKGLFDVAKCIILDIMSFIYLQLIHVFFKILKGNKFLLTQYYRIKDKEDGNEAE